MNKAITSKLTLLLFAAAMCGATGCRTSSTYSRSTGEWWDDNTVSRKVHKALNRNSLTKKAPIEVKSYRGDVVLTGFVDHPIQKEEATDVVKAVEGVQWVQNSITVKSKTPHAQIMGTQVHDPAGAETQQWEKGLFNNTGKKATGATSTQSSSSQSSSGSGKAFTTDPSTGTAAPEPK